MYVFLTGESGVGKSTALDRTLTLLGITPGGFRTGFTPDRQRLCLWPAWEGPDWSEEHTVARMVHGRLVGDPDAFDRLGPVILSESMPWAGLLLLDELGWLEREALAFQGAVRTCLGGTTPVLGVMIPDEPGGLNQVLQVLNEAAVNVEYMYAFLGGADADHAYMIFRVQDGAAAAAALSARGIHLVDQDEVAGL